MAVWSSITTSQIEYSRIDADYYHPAYLSEMTIWQRLKERNNVAKLHHLIRVPVRTGRTPRSRRIKDGELCVHFIKTDTLREGSVDFNNSDFLPSRIISENDYIPNDSVIITIIGATPEIVGRAAIIREEDPECVTNQNVAVVCTNEKCDPYYLTAFFQTRLGRDQLWRHSRRTEQVNLNCREVERVLVPSLSSIQQNQIGDLVRSSFKSSVQSVNLYQQAQHLLESELGLKKLNFQKPVGFTVRFSELEHSRRSDAEFFHTKYEPFLSAIKSYRGGWTTLRLLTNRTLPNFNGKGYSEDYEYVEIGDINVGDGAYTSSRIPAKQLPANAKIVLNGCEILISQVRPTRGAIAIIDDNLSHPTICSGAFYVCTVNDSHQREALWLYLRIIRSVFEKYCGGTSYPTIESNYIAKFPVPVFPKKMAMRIRELILKSKTAKKESQRLITLAKTSVENLIEEAVRQ